MADDLYDIFFYGSIHQGDELVVTKKRVAKLLNIKDDKIDALFSHPDGIQLKSAATLKVAEQYKAALTKVGAKCEFQPTKVKPKPKPKLTKPGGPLELIPKSDAAASKERVFTCPACQFEKTLAADEASP